MNYTYFEAPFGDLLLLGQSKLERIYFPQSKSRIKPSDTWKEEAECFREVLDQLDSYFKGTRFEFDVALELRGTAFQMKVWEALAGVPYGTTTSYGELAAKIGNPKASRAVGMANGKNPIPIIIPCHRVIGKNGSLTGFGGGLEVKRMLLDLEKKQPLTSGKIAF